jgi:tripartite-type tricarboxylate transporter receptor subunit TctC
LSRESEHGPSGIGTLQHVAGKLFKMMTGVVHVPYRSAPASLIDLIGGQVR